MLDIPEIVAANQPPAIAMITQKPGGCSKSFGTQIVVDGAYRSGLDLHIFQNDNQPFYDPYGAVHHTPLPATDEVVHDPIADVRVHSLFDRTLLQAGSTDCLIYDCAAGSLNRHTYIVDQLDLGLRLAAMGRHILILVPTSAREDIARESLETVEVWRDLLPEPHRIVPMISQRDGDIHRLPSGHDLRKLMKIATDGAYLLPRIPMSVLNDIRRSGMKLCDLADPRNPLATAEMARTMGMDPTIVQLMRRAAGTLLSETDEQTMRLGFTLGL